MDKFLLRAFQSLPETQVPNDLHAAIFRAAAFRRSWKYVSMLTLVIGLAFVFSIWHLYTRTIEIDALSSLKSIWGSLDLTLDSIIDSAQSLIDSLPVQSIIITMLNLIALIFMTFIFRSFSRLQEQFKM